MHVNHKSEFLMTEWGRWMWQDGGMAQLQGRSRVFSSVLPGSRPAVAQISDDVAMAIMCEMQALKRYDAQAYQACDLYYRMSKTKIVIAEQLGVGRDRVPVLMEVGRAFVMRGLILGNTKKLMKKLVA